MTWFRADCGFYWELLKKREVNKRLSDFLVPALFFPLLAFTSFILLLSTLKFHYCVRDKVLQVKLPLLSTYLFTQVSFLHEQNDSYCSFHI